MLARFKEEFEKHKEFLLAPTIHRADGNLYMEPMLGIIKNVIFFRQLYRTSPHRMTRTQPHRRCRSSSRRPPEPVLPVLNCSNRRGIE